MPQEAPRQDVAVSKLTEFYNLVGDLLVRTTRRSRAIQLVSIVLSVATTGILWTLIVSNFATAAAWIGAVTTTILSFLSLFQATIGPEQKIRQLQRLYSDSGEYLARLVAEDGFDYPRFADTLRRFEMMIREIETDHPIVRTDANLGAPLWSTVEETETSRRNAAVKKELLAGVSEMQEEIKIHLTSPPKV